MKKMLNELDARGQSDEKRLSEMNVTIENLNMNVSLQNRTVMGLVEDRKLPTDCRALQPLKQFQTWRWMTPDFVRIFF